MHLPERLREFVAERGDVPVEDALVALASCRPNGNVDASAAAAALDQISADVQAPTLAGVCDAVFARAGYAGDRIDYHDPRNSLLDCVISRRVGMPITLSVIVVAVARRSEVPVEAIGAPGHFLVRDPLTGEFRDPFAGGTIVPAEVLLDAVRRLHPSAGSADHLLAPVSDFSTFSRVLNNLQNSFAARNPRGLDWLLPIRLDLPEALQGDPLVLASLCERRGYYREAAMILARLGERLDDDAIRSRAAAVEARLN